MTLLIVTACRCSDLVLFGPRNIEDVDGRPYISFVQEKTGYLDRARAQIPLVTPLADVITATTTGEETFLTTDYGKAFSKNGFGSRFKTRSGEAGLCAYLAAHGVRKAVGVILAEAGCSQYEIMSLHGHSDPATGKIYTATVDRRKLAETGLGRLDLGKIMG